MQKYCAKKVQGNAITEHGEKGVTKHDFSKAGRDMNLSESAYKVGSIFLQNGDFDVTVGKRDAKSLERDRTAVTVGTKNSRRRASKTRLSQP